MMSYELDSCNFIFKIKFYVCFLLNRYLQNYMQKYVKYRRNVQFIFIA